MNQKVVFSSQANPEKQICVGGKIFLQPCPGSWLDPNLLAAMERMWQVFMITKLN